MQNLNIRSELSRDEALLSIAHARAIDMIGSEASLSRAAKRLHASQSTLSRMVADAERELGARLFERGWSGMEPTVHGGIAIAHSRRMMADIRAVQTEMQGWDGGERVCDLTHHLSFELLDMLEAVCRAGSASAAAAFLGTSQPRISRAIGQISASSGRPVFERTASGLRPTRAALLLRDLRNRLLAEARTVPRQFRTVAGDVTGRVAVGVLPFSEQEIVVKTFGRMLRRHRHVRLQAVTGSYGALTDGLKNGELDVVLGPLREPAPFESLEETRLFPEKLAVVARSAHPRLHRFRQAVDLLEETWIVGPHGTPTRRYFEEFFIAQGLTPPTRTCEIVTFFLAEQMILNSDVVGLLSYTPARERSLRPGLLILPLDLGSAVRNVGFTMRKAQPRTPAQAAFLEALFEERDEADERADRPVRSEGPRGNP